MSNVERQDEPTIIDPQQLTERELGVILGAEIFDPRSYEIRMRSKRGKSLFMGQRTIQGIAGILANGNGKVLEEKILIAARDSKQIIINHSPR